MSFGDIRDEPIRFNDIVQMGNPPQYSWECAYCQSQSGLEYSTRHQALKGLEDHEEAEHPGFKGEWEPWRPPEEKAYDIERGKRT